MKVNQSTQTAKAYEILNHLKSIPGYKERCQAMFTEVYSNRRLESTHLSQEQLELRSSMPCTYEDTFTDHTVPFDDVVQGTSSLSSDDLEINNAQFKIQTLSEFLHKNYPSES